MDNKGNFIEDSNYVDVNGRAVKVYVCENSGQIAIPIQEVRKTGFNIYHKTQYNKLHISADQFLKEFHLYMLDAAKTYMLQRQTAFKEDDIFESINRCKKVLAGEETNNSTNSLDFFNNRTVTESPQGFTITRPVQNTDRSRSDSTSSSQHGPNSQHFSRVGAFSSTTSEASVGLHQFNRENIPNQSMDKSRFSNQDQNNRKSATQNGYTTEQKRNEDRKEQLPRLPSIRFDKGFHKVLVTHIDAEAIYVQDAANSEILLNIDSTIKDHVNSMSVLSGAELLFNQIYLAEYEGEWARCKVIKFKPMKIYFIDYGNTGTVSEVKELPSKLATVPCQAAKITLKNRNKTMVLNQLYKIKVLNIDMGVPVADIVDDEDSILVTPPKKIIPIKEDFTPSISVKKFQKTPPQKLVTPAFFTRPKEMDSVENGTMICVATRQQDKLVVRTKRECCKVEKIEKLIEESPSSIIDEPRIGQLVLSKIDNVTHRGVVEKLLDDGVEVQLLDYYEKKIVEKENVRQISKEISEELVTFWVTPPLKNYVNVETVNDFLNHFIEKRIKGVAHFDGEFFDIKYSDSFLSDVLGEIVSKTTLSTPDKTPLLPKTSSTPNKTPPSSFPVITPKLGLGTYYIYFFDSSKNFSITSVEELEEHLTVVMKQDVAEDASYIPKIGDVCYANYDGTWSRAIILKQNSGEFEIKFIDFGNSSTVDVSSIRRLTDDAKAVPMLAVSCYINESSGLGDFEDKIKETVQEGETYEINVKKLAGKSYEVEIPALSKLTV